MWITSLHPNFGAGVYYHTNKFYVGLSVPNFLETEHFDTSEGGTNTLATENELLLDRWICFSFEYGLEVQTCGIGEGGQGAPLATDVSANFLYDDKLSFGAAYRWSAALSALVGYQISDQLMVGMAYDRETTELGNSSFNDGSFEAFIRYEFKTKYKKVVTPRFF